MLFERLFNNAKSEQPHTTMPNKPAAHWLKPGFASHPGNRRRERFFESAARWTSTDPGYASHGLNGSASRRSPNPITFPARYSWLRYTRAGRHPAQWIHSFYSGVHAGYCLGVAAPTVLSVATGSAEEVIARQRGVAYRNYAPAYRSAGTHSG
jgi:hypothetical protein